MDRRSDLRFGRLDEIPLEADRLLAGHEACGGWTLGQILYHLATSVRLTNLGRRAPAATSSPEADRLASISKRLFFRAGRFPDGVEVPDPALEPPTDADARAAADSLRSALRRFSESEGPFPAHPTLGPLSREEWDAFHRIHCAHHLGFVRPTPGPTDPPPASGGHAAGGPA